MPQDGAQSSYAQATDQSQVAFLAHALGDSEYLVQLTKAYQPCMQNWLRSFRWDYINLLTLYNRSYQPWGAE